MATLISQGNCINRESEKVYAYQELHDHSGSFFKVFIDEKFRVLSKLAFNENYFKIQLRKARENEHAI